MRNLLFALLLFMPLTAGAGTYYYIYPERNAHCDGELPNRFSVFLEGEDAWGESSEYARLKKATGLDLELFKDNAIGSETEKPIWISLDTIHNRLVRFRHALNALQHPEQLVDYDPRKPMRDSLRNLAWSKGYTENREAIEAAWRSLDSQIMKDEASPYFLLPADGGYLRERKLQKDLESLIALLECYRRKGIGRVFIVYS